MRVLKQLAGSLVVFGIVIVVVGATSGWGYWVGVIVLIGVAFYSLLGLTAFLLSMSRRRAEDKP